MKSKFKGARVSAQDGYTAVEMIITMALTAIVSGAMFSSFLVLDRVQTAWEERDQARAVGVIAEEPLLRDVQAYSVVSMDPRGSYATDSSPSPALSLNGIATEGSNFQVDYQVGLSGGEPVLRRFISTERVPRVIAHGVIHVSTCVDYQTGTIKLTMLLKSIGSRARQVEQVPVSPALELTPRNGLPRNPAWKC